MVHDVHEKLEMKPLSIRRLFAVIAVLCGMIQFKVWRTVSEEGTLFQLVNHDSFQVRLSSSSSLVSPPKSCQELGLEEEEDQHDESFEEEGFSACLMVMDDNHFLIEWLAYHFTTLPLKRLIVAIDPKSETLPTTIFDRYRNLGLMNITEWIDEHDYFPVEQEREKLQTQFPNDTVEVIKGMYVSQQLHFFSKCMETLQQENRTWTAFIDSDEYLLMNANVATEKRQLVTHRTNKTIYSTLKTAAQMNNNRSEEWCDNLQFLGQSIQANPCLLMPRLVFGTKSSTNDEVASQVPNGFKGMDFTTLQWRWHGGLSNFKINRYPKGMIDVSRVKVPLIPKWTVEVHSPVRQYCDRHVRATSNAQSSFVVHHYVGSWEQWGYRKDVRRSKELYDQKAYFAGSDDHIRPWLQGFVDQVGLEMALQLLEGAGHVERNATTY